MSSHNSMSIVLKCLSKGAVDFLVKPIRKNELKNLWQHVWRKYHSMSCTSYPNPCMEPYHGPVLDSKLQASGSVNERAVRIQKSTMSKVADESENNTGSNDKNDSGSIGPNARDGSDKGSGTQSSWTKRPIEIDSAEPILPCAQLDDPHPPHSTCAQVIHSRPEAFGNNWVPVTTTECEGQDDEIDNFAMGKKLEIGAPRILNLQLEDLREKAPTNTEGNNGEKFLEINSSKDDEPINKGQLELNNEKQSDEFRKQPSDAREVINNSNNPQIESIVFDKANGLSEVPNTEKEAVYESKDMPSLELSLKRLRNIEDTGTSGRDRNVLSHSDFSAFSKYNSASIANQSPTGNVGSCCPLDNSSEAANFQSNSNSTPPNQHSNGSSNNNDMGSTTNNAFTKPVVFSDKPTSKSASKSLHPSSAFQPVQNCQMAPNQHSNGSSNNNDMGSTTNNAFTKPVVFSDKPTTKSTSKSLHAFSTFQPVQNCWMPLSEPITQCNADTAVTNKILAQASCMNQHVQVHQHHHHHHHNVRNMLQHLLQQQLGNHENLSMQNILSSAAPHCGLNNMLSTQIEGNACSHISKGIDLGSDQGSNVQNGNSTALGTRGANMESDNGVGETGGGIGFGSRTRIGQNCFAIREAALSKFRQKRKKRCFEKKVRYQSRKKLAEQRPRIRGQFVRQAALAHEND